MATNSKADNGGGDSQAKSSSSRARAGRLGRRKTEAPPGKPVVEKPAVDVSKSPTVKAADPRSPTVKAADPRSLTNAAAELQALDEEHLQKLAASQRSRVIKAIILGVIGVLFVAFVLQNAQPVNVNLVFGTITIGMIWVIVTCALLGALAGFLVARPDQNLHFHLPDRRGKRGKKTTTAG